MICRRWNSTPRHPPPIGASGGRGDEIIDEPTREGPSKESMECLLCPLVRLRRTRRGESPSAVDVQEIGLHHAGCVEPRRIQPLDRTTVAPVVADEGSRSPDVALAEVPEGRTEILDGGGRTRVLPIEDGQPPLAEEDIFRAHIEVAHLCRGVQR